MPKLLKNTSPTSKSTSKKGQRVFVGLSGGVDSAVAAALLLRQGYDVTGVFIKVWQPDFLPCTWREERRDAMRVAARLGIPFLFFDFSSEYKKGVADYMISEYRAGRTPNPDVLCNREIKFGAFWQKAKKLGADFVATGHYAGIEKDDSGAYKLLEGEDKSKDQSYFLWMLEQNELSHILFPLQNLKKDEVRKLAKKFDLPTATKKDSQGICFLGDVDLEDFLSHFIDTKPGDVVNTSGEVIGRHNGALYYTLGERHGFTTKHNESNSKPMFVVSKDLEHNIITVAETKPLVSKTILERVNWITRPNTNQLEVRVRYRQEKSSATLSGDEILFDEQQTLASGQSIVFYVGNVCMGGAIIA